MADPDDLDEAELARPAPRPTPAQRLRAMLEWIGPRRVAATVVFAVAAGVGGWWLLHAPAPAVERTLPNAARTTVAVASGGTRPPAATDAPVTTSAVAVVHVAGAVTHPGLVRIPSSGRVYDAILAAGGATEDADLDALNLAAAVVDGQRIYVPRQGEIVPVDAGPGTGSGSGSGSGGAGGPSTTAGLVDINTATVEQLDTLPGIGPSTAAAIVAHREANGPFRAVDDLLDVKGIGPAKLAQFRDLVTV